MRTPSRVRVRRGGSLDGEEFGRELVERANVLEREQSWEGMEDIHRVVLGKTQCMAGKVLADRHGQDAKEVDSGSCHAPDV